MKSDISEISSSRHLTETRKPEISSGGDWRVHRENEVSLGEIDTILPSNSTREYLSTK